MFCRKNCAQFFWPAIQNKAVYTAALVADGWAGAENLEKGLCDGHTDIRTYGPTDRRTEKWLIESRVRD